MAEDRLIELYFIAQGEFRSSLQWWVGISIGVAALGHLVIRKLNLGLLVLICVLYIGFTYSSLAVLARLASVSAAFRQDLGNLSSAGEVTIATQRLLELGPGEALPLSPVAIVLSGLGTFLGCLSFLIWSYFQTRNRPKV
jgi:hypothetical protein